MIILFSGYKGSGKSTAVEFFEDKGFVDIKMAATLKKMLKVLFLEAGYSEAYADECIEGSLKEVPVPVLGGATTRHAMQQLGTEWRNSVYANLWTDIWVHKAKNGPDNIVCSDIRFIKEIEAVKSMFTDVILIYINRPVDKTDTHESEKSLEQYADIVIDNDSTLEVYIERLQKLWDGLQQHYSLQC